MSIQTPHTVWYVSKYNILPSPGNAVGSRGFRIMVELARRGHRTVVVTSDSNHLAASGRESDRPYDAEDIEGVTVATVRTLKVTRARSWRRAASWLDFEWRLFRMPVQELPRPDAVIVSSLSLLTILNGFALRRRFGARLVFEVRDIWPLTLTEEGGFSRWNPLVMALAVVERWGYRSSDAIVGTMPNLGEHVAEVLGEPRDVACIPMGVTDQHLAEGDELPEQYVDHLSDGRFKIVYAGTLGITNALQTLMECAQMAHDAGENGLHFVVVGDGDVKDQLVREYGDLPNLTFLAKVPKAQVPTLLAWSDLLYFSVHESNVWKYGQSLNKLIDYMAAGKPIVASYTGYPSMINEADCGTFVPAGDARAALGEVLRYRDMPASERQQIGARGRTWLQRNRGYSKLAAEYLAVLAIRGTGTPHLSMSPSLSHSDLNE